MRTSNGHDDGSDEQEPGDMTVMHPLKEKWIQYGVISLGIRPVFSPIALGYESTLMTWSDVLTDPYSSR